MKKLILSACLMLTFILPALAKEEAMTQPQLAKATFAGGCFWCMQPFFDRLNGVKETVVGYIGGKTANPTYEEVSSGQSGHAEAIEITYDPTLVSYEKLLNIYWRNIDPTALNAQFVDEGTQYRTAIFYHDEAQRIAAEQSKQALSDSKKFDAPIVTEIVPATTFYPAESYHQKYYQKNAFRYKLYHDGSGREEFLKQTWGDEHK